MESIVDGNKAVAQAAIETGVRFFSHYPGSPVNKVEVYLRELERNYESGIVFNDSLNEHVAVLAAAGASFCGQRSMVVMKHVGLNIAADPLNYLGYTGVQGGMVIVVGTDPGATCSTGEEDVHWYVPQVNFPLFEPATVSGIRDSVGEAYRLSESYEVPVFIFLPAAICYNSDLLSDPLPPADAGRKPARFRRDHARYTNVGAKAVDNHRRLIERIESVGKNESRVESFFNAGASVGVITRGVTFGHSYEAIRELALEDRLSLLNLEMTYPVNRDLVAEFARGKDSIIVIEDQDGFVENQVKMNLFNELDCRIFGKELFPAFGAVSYDMVERVLAQYFEIETADPDLAPVGGEATPERMGTYCEGCPHRSSFYALEQVSADGDVIIGGDIGCSSLPPHKPDWLMCMNAGVGISQGMSQVVDGQVAISTGGDGSFFHIGLMSLMNAVFNRIDLLHVLLDNSTIAMTGHQPSLTSPGNDVDMRMLLRSIGVDQVEEVNAFNPGEYESALRRQLAGQGVRVIWVRGACALQPDEEWLRRRRVRSLELHPEKCGECSLCYSKLQCPAINRDADSNLFIDMQRCMRCGVCLEICPNEAIEVRETADAV